MKKVKRMYKQYIGGPTRKPVREGASSNRFRNKKAGRSVKY